MTVDIRPGFADPVRGAQATFRAVLTAMSRPGTLLAAGAGLIPPAPLDPATAAVLLTLIDAETAVWVDPAFDAARPWIAFHCGANFARAPAEADFVVCRRWIDPADLRMGDHETPQNGATMILQVAVLGAGPSWRLSGPGIAAEQRLDAGKLPPDFAARWAANHARFPCGIDLILCAGATIAAVPRSVAVTG